MATPKKPGKPAGSMSWLDYAFGLASRTVGKTWADMRTEYEAGRAGRPSPEKQPRSAPGSARVGPPWWKVLGVPRGVSLAEATAAYRDRIRQNHPDKVAHLSEPIRRVADEETRRLNAAYAEARKMLQRPGGAAPR